MEFGLAEKVRDEPRLVIIDSKKVLQSWVLRHEGNSCRFERDQFRWLGIDEDSKVTREQVDFGVVGLVPTNDSACYLKGSEGKPLEGGESVEIREYPLNGIHPCGVSQGLCVR